MIIGDTHRIQLCWAAIWDSHIGHAQLIDAAQQIVTPGRNRREPVARLVTVAVTGLGGPAGTWQAVVMVGPAEDDGCAQLHVPVH